MNNVIKNSQNGSDCGGIVGIYKIENKFNGKVYIGQSIDINRRFKEHKNSLKNNKHHNTHLQYAFNKYGEDNFTFEIIDVCEIDELDALERLYINKYECKHDEWGYNLEDGGNENKKLSKAALEKRQEFWNSEKGQQLKKEYSERYRNNTSNSTTGIMHLFKKNSKDTTQGFRWIYRYSENGKTKEITSISLITLKEKALSKGLPWEIIDEDKAKQLFEEYGKTKKQLTWKFGIKRVSKVKLNNKQGFTWMYSVNVDGKKKQITAAKIHKLHEKVIKQGLPWEILDEEKAKETMKKYN